MQAVIMAGGEGSRLRPLTCDLPKPMARLCGRPILDYILDLLRDNGCQKAHITLKYLPQVITAYYKDFSDQQLSLRFVEEDKPLGTAGSVRAAAMGEIDDDFIVISGEHSG